MRHSFFIAVVFLLAACTVTEPLLYQGTTGGSPLPAPVYVYQEKSFSYYDYIVNFIGTTQRITLMNREKTRVIDFIKQQDIHTFLSAPYMPLYFSETDKAGKLFVQAGSVNAGVWDLTTGKLVHWFKPVSSHSIHTRLSPDGKTLLFNSRLWDVMTAEQKMDLGDNLIQDSAAFSDDGRYFALGGRPGTQWLDLQTKQVEWLPTEIDTDHILFGRDKRLYRSYGRSAADADGIRRREITVSRLEDNKILATFGPRTQIVCWVMLPNQQQFVALKDRTLIWFDEDLNMKKQWRSELEVRACLPDKHNRIWLGTDKRGLLRLNPEQGLLKQVLPYTHRIESVKLSSDENYLGLVLAPADMSRVEIYKTADLQ